DRPKRWPREVDKILSCLIPLTELGSDGFRLVSMRIENVDIRRPHHRRLDDRWKGSALEEVRSGSKHQAENPVLRVVARAVVVGEQRRAFGELAPERHGGVVD